MTNEDMRPTSPPGWAKALKYCLVIGLVVAVCAAGIFFAVRIKERRLAESRALAWNAHPEWATLKTFVAAPDVRIFLAEGEAWFQEGQFIDEVATIPISPAGEELSAIVCSQICAAIEADIENHIPLPPLEDGYMADIAADLLTFRSGTAQMQILVFHDDFAISSAAHDPWLRSNRIIGGQLIPILMRASKRTNTGHRQE